MTTFRTRDQRDVSSMQKNAVATLITLRGDYGKSVPNNRDIHAWIPLYLALPLLEETKLLLNV